MRRIALLPAALAAATLLVLLVFAGIVRQNVLQMRSLREQTARVEHTLQVQRELDAVLLNASEADSAARGFLLSGGDASFTEFTQARLQLEQSLTRLSQLTRDNPSQQERIGRLEDAIAARMTGLDRVLQVRRTGTLSTAMDDARTTDTNRWRAEIRGIAAEMEAAEARLLESRRAEVDEAFTRDRLANKYDRCFHPAGVEAQVMSVGASGDRTERLRELSVPTTVIHGQVDGLLGPAHGEATGAAIPDAKLVMLAEMGHDLPELYWPTYLEELIALADRAEAR